MTLRRTSVLIGLALVSTLAAISARADIVGGDSDRDGDTDLRDFGAYQVCFSGDGGGVREGCAVFDLDADDDVDDDDFVMFGCAFAGPEVRSPAVQIPDPPGPTVELVVMLEGTTEGARLVEVTGGAQPASAETVDCNFTVGVELNPNSVNRLFVTAVYGDGTRSAPAPVSITHDQEAPELFIDFPTDGAEITTETTDVAGRVGDRLIGFSGLRVAVNGRRADVDEGVGNNGTFFRRGVPLQLGENTIEAIALDELDNTVVRRITVNRIEIPKEAPRMVIEDGNAQLGQIGTWLPDPIIVLVTHGDGSAFANKVVTFEVTRSNGRLGEDDSGEGHIMIQLFTDENGKAAVRWKVGSDAGRGNNRVEVTSRSIFGTIVFCASATPAPPVQINVGSGNSQRAEVAGPAPEPLRVWVSDACNGIEGIPVTFTVVQGNGTISGQDQVEVPTSRTGHAEVSLVLGPNPGNNRVRATIPGKEDAPAVFSIFGIERVEGHPTTFTGLVMDNAEQPIQGATCTLKINGESLPPVQSDINGQFLIGSIPGQGSADLYINGLTAFHIGGKNGRDIEPGSFPALHYTPVVVPEAENSLPIPVLLPALNPNNVMAYSRTQDTELTVQGIEELKMVVKAGSMKINDEPAPNGTPIALNQVHFDDVPMPMPDGAAPPFAWTLQPSGATFDPPVSISYPNMSGLPAGSISYFLSFDHDTNRFEIVATGHVADDGVTIMTDPGAGIRTAGWGGICPPYPITEDVEEMFERCENLQNDQRRQCECLKAGRRCYSRQGIDFGICLDYSIARFGPRVGAIAGLFVCRIPQKFSVDRCNEEYYECWGRQPLPSVCIEDDEIFNRLVPIAEEIVKLLEPYPDGDLPPEVEEQLIALLEEADKIAGGDAGEYVRGLVTDCFLEQEERNIYHPFDSSWQFTVAGQTVTADSDGSFLVTNVSTPDNFGDEGPGSEPDSLGDDFLRVSGVSPNYGVTRYAQSECFQITQGETFEIDSMSISV